MIFENTSNDGIYSYAIIHVYDFNYPVTVRLHFQEIGIIPSQRNLWMLL